MTEEQSSPLPSEVIFRPTFTGGTNTKPAKASMKTNANSIVGPLQTALATHMASESGGTPAQNVQCEVMYNDNDGTFYIQCRVV